MNYQTEFDMYKDIVSIMDMICSKIIFLCWMIEDYKKRKCPKGGIENK